MMKETPAPRGEGTDELAGFRQHGTGPGQSKRTNVELKSRLLSGFPGRFSGFRTLALLETPFAGLRPEVLAGKSLQTSLSYRSIPGWRCHPKRSEGPEKTPAQPISPE
ncbi:MAG: hypothetical protein IT260_24045 [Saprospiraceae bacterium]|nr:hypothetical protein [Saprospiraceae bacterium]